MRLLLTVLALLASLNAMADAEVFTHDAGVFAHSDCQRLSQSERARVQALDQGMSEQAALLAEKEVHLRLSAKLTDRPRLQSSARQLAATLEGWMLKKEWLGALARREHDADEGGAYCEFLLQQMRAE